MSTSGGDYLSWVGLVIASILFVLGLAGTLLPVLPGAPLIWLGMFIYGFWVDFQGLSWQFFLGQGLLVVVILAADYVASALGAKKYGGSPAAIWGSVAGGIIGIMAFGPLGLIIGVFLGALVPELATGKSLAGALATGWGTIIGLVTGTIIKLGVEAAMIIWFLVLIF